MLHHTYNAASPSFYTTNSEQVANLRNLYLLIFHFYPFELAEEVEA